MGLYQPITQFALTGLWGAVRLRGGRRTPDQPHPANRSGAGGGRDRLRVLHHGGHLRPGHLGQEGDGLDPRRVCLDCAIPDDGWPVRIRLVHRGTANPGDRGAKGSGRKTSAIRYRGGVVWQGDPGRGTGSDPGLASSSQPSRHARLGGTPHPVDEHRHQGSGSPCPLALVLVGAMAGLIPGTASSGRRSFDSVAPCVTRPHPIPTGVSRNAG